MSRKFFIRISMRDPRTGNFTTSGRDVGWSHTIERAVERGNTFSQFLANAVYVYVTDGTRVVACNDIHNGPFTGDVRPLTLISRLAKEPPCQTKQSPNASMTV